MFWVRTKFFRLVSWQHFDVGYAWSMHKRHDRVESINVVSYKSKSLGSNTTIMSVVDVTANVEE